MKSISAFFHSLRGKLIVTYTTVTILALLALEILVLLLVFAFTTGTDTDLNTYLSDVVAVLPGQARGFLQPGERDLDGLQAWLQNTYDIGRASLPAQGIFDSPAALIVKGEPMYVLAPDGSVLAAAPESAQNLVGRKYSSPADVKSGEVVLQNALNLDLNTEDLAAMTPAGNYLMAVPVQQSIGEGPLSAVVIVTVSPPHSWFIQNWSQLLVIVPITGFVLLLAVVPFGALFGFIMSRGLTRRLKALSTAADAWSEGNFTVQPQDSSQDEISTLGLRLRRMAENVQVLLQTRKELALLEERNRLARELHDTVKQETFATLMQVRAAKNLLASDPAGARMRLDEAEVLIKSSQKELSEMIAELRPSALDDRGLAESLRDFAASWSKHSCIPVDIQVQNERRLPLEVEQTLFRVVQEGLSNVARHSRASAASIRMSFDPESVTICVSDNGIGFNPAKNNGGFGLQSMRERLAAIGGSLAIESAQNAGTTITASAPTAVDGRGSDE